MIKSNKYIFNLLAEFVEDKNIERPILADAKRCIETNDREREWLQKLKIENTQSILPRFTTAYFEFERLFIEGAKNIPFDNLVFSLVSVYWRYSFLDVYRCIERLFSISFLEEIYQDLGIENSLSLLNFSVKIEKYIGWRPEEIGSCVPFMEN